MALKSLAAGEIKLPTALVDVGEDLRDTYFFRAREALNNLDEALGKDMGSRAAEWAGQARAYFAILQPDFATKLGDDAAASLIADLDSLQTAVVAADSASASDLLARIRDEIADYQPVRLTSVEVSERGALLHTFTNLIATEYRNAVFNGTMTNAIEFQEATTFRDQAQTVFEELRGDIADADAAQRLGDIYAQLDSLMASYGSKDTVIDLVTEASGLIESSLTIDTTATNATAAFAIIDNLLGSMVKSARAGRYAEAEQLRLQAYAIFDSGPEPHLVAFAPDRIPQVEGLFWQGYNDTAGLAQALANEAPVAQVIATRNQLANALADAKVIVGQSASEPLAIMVNAAVIVFREGLEAVVILAALMAGMVGANAYYRRPLIAGAGVALVVSIATWFLAQGILDMFRAFGEQLEAVVSLIAIGVLLLITNWFFHKVYWTQWIAGFHKQKRSLLGREVEIGQLLGLALLGFTSVYREGFETVLFLQALELEVGTLTVLQGVLLGGLGVALVGLVTFRLQRRLPYRKMLVWTGVLIGVVLVTMVGNTVHVMQVLGWLPITPIRGLLLPAALGVWFGIFATWQGILLQIGAAAFVIGSYFLAEHQAARRRSKPREIGAIEASGSV